VFVLDAKLQVVAGASDEGRTITLAAAADTAQVINLTFDAKIGGFVAKWTLVEEPTRLTILVKKDNVIHATIAGYKPGVVLAVGKKAPRIKIHANGMGGGPKNDLAKDDPGDHDNGKGNDFKLKDGADGKDKLTGKDKDKDKGNDKSAAKPVSVKIETKDPKPADPKAKPADPQPTKGNDKPKGK
jgi:hypothetical protein